MPKAKNFGAAQTVRELKQQITSNQEECFIAQASNTIETEQMNVSISQSQDMNQEISKDC